MSLATNFLLGVVLLSIISLARGSCWRYGHSCWGGHGKRSGEPPGGGTKKELQILPVLLNRISQVTGDYYDEEGLEPEGEDVSFPEEVNDALENGGRKLNSNLPAFPASASVSGEVGWFYPELISTSNEIMEVDLGGGEVIDPDVLVRDGSIEEEASQNLLNSRGRKGSQKRRRTVVMYRFQGRRR